MPGNRGFVQCSGSCNVRKQMPAGSLAARRMETPFAADLMGLTCPFRADFTGVFATPSVGLRLHICSAPWLARQWMRQCRKKKGGGATLSKFQIGSCPKIDFIFETASYRGVGVRRVSKNKSLISVCFFSVYEVLFYGR